MEWLTTLLGGEGGAASPLLVWGVIAVLAIIAIWLLLRIMRRVPAVSGKRKQARLAVTDAAAVDSRRKLVLIRRDDVEHLIMIGGPMDLVIESEIKGGVAASPAQGANRGTGQQPNSQQPNSHQPNAHQPNALHPPVAKADAKPDPDEPAAKAAAAASTVAAPASATDRRVRVEPAVAKTEKPVPSALAGEPSSTTEASAPSVRASTASVSSGSASQRAPAPNRMPFNSDSKSSARPAQDGGQPASQMQAANAPGTTSSSTASPTASGNSSGTTGDPAAPPASATASTTPAPKSGSETSQRASATTAKPPEAGTEISEKEAKPDVLFGERKTTSGG